MASVAPATPVASAAAVRAPLVGIFYRRAEPGRPPMVEIGDRVEAGQPLAIVEAMKMMNEVLSSVAGTIIGIHAEDQDVVEFDKLLFTIQKPA
jgi:acetyl-CoA carboxylase biotin carboxyl carrier protein